MYPKGLPAHPYAAPTLHASSSPALKPSSKTDDQNCNGKAEYLNAHSQSNSNNTTNGDDHVNGKGGADTGDSDKDMNGKGGKDSDESSGQKKSKTTPDVVCGRFLFKEPNGDDADMAGESGGR